MRILILVLIVSCGFCFSSISVLAQAGNNASEEIPTFNSVENFLSSIPIDLPPSIVTCRASGSLTQIFSRTHSFKSNGNTFFVDKETREIANFQRAVIDEPDKKVFLQVFIKIPDVERETLVDLLIKKKIIASKNANVTLIAKILTSDGEVVLINEGADKKTKEGNSIIFTKIFKLGNLIFNGEKFVTGDGVIKIRFPSPPKKVDADGNLVDFFENEPGVLVCTCKNCPFHDFDLIDLKDAFDGDLVGDVIDEASEQPE